MTSRSAAVEQLQALHGLRAVAALYVVGHHVAVNLAESGLLRNLFRFGQEAVIVFFVLSGFVICLSTRGGTRDSLKRYAIKRWVRIYPIFLAALLVTYLVACARLGGLADPKPVELLGNLLMLQDIQSGRAGHWFNAYRANHPLWSLSYEIWFYALFPMVIAWRGSVARGLVAATWISVTGALTAIVMPNPLSVFASYFGIWWLGVSLAEQYRHTGEVTLRGQRGALLLVVGLCAIACLEVARLGLSDALSYPTLVLRHLLGALVMVLFGLGIVAHAGLRSAACRLLNPWALLAPISYAMYALHEPLLIHTAFEGPLKWPGVALGFVVTLLLSYLLEVRMQPHLSRWALCALAPAERLEEPAGS